jgi:hypothetical protein
MEPLTDVKPFRQAETVRHDSLVRSPALLGDKLEQGPRPLAAAKQEVEKLVDKGIIEGQRIAGENDAGHLLDKPRFKPGPCTLDNKSFQGMRFSGRQFQSEDSPKRNPHHHGCFQAVVVEKLLQIPDQVQQAEPPAQGKTIVFPPKLVTQNAIMLGQQAGYRS